MGFFDMFSNIEDWDPKDLQTGGIIGASMMAKARKLAEERAKRLKPGRFCNKTCVIDDERCSPCLALQKDFEMQISQLEKLEEMETLSAEQVQQLKQSKTITKCSLCGAPYERGERACPYCGTAYAENAIDFDIPLSKVERHNLIMSKAEETWEVFMKLSMLNLQYAKDTADPGWIGAIVKFTAGVGTAMPNMLKQNASEIQQAAGHYGVPISQYICGVLSGEMKTLKALQYE